ncbi:hypothetical protein GPECTOR_49g485 [Gonium pectorale]|uniref:TLC domain-containing protein n=1 Tax=Gonium pectorale TaxID=33097 RepID=A0A150G7V5_GONPE|nr:hypothetical protein GPECTOR_49g485 [Gonium pectorale]|eukprot:KXZ45901.1 hypothetical protein GPECTOR_49g485 [Gonium pectorale]
MLFGDAATSLVIAVLFGSFALLGLRYAFYVVCYERVRVHLRRRGPGYEAYVPVITEELWEGLGNSAILALSSAALARGVTDACTPADTSGCLRGWPQHPAPLSLDGLFLLQIAWHGHCAAKAWVGLGRVQGLDAAAHHAATLAALGLAYWWGLLRIGVLALWVFGAATPLLSASKILHCLYVRPAKKIVFVLFTAAYFASRVLAVPLVLLPCTLRDVWETPLDARAAVAANGFLLALYGLSLFWFGRLLGILATGKLDATPRMVVSVEARRWQKQQ